MLRNTVFRFATQNTGENRQELVILEEDASSTESVITLFIILPIFVIIIAIMTFYAASSAMSNSSSTNRFDTLNDPAVDDLLVEHEHKLVLYQLNLCELNEIFQIL